MHSRKHRFFFTGLFLVVIIYLFANMFIIVPSFSRLLVRDFEEHAEQIATHLSNMVVLEDHLIFDRNNPVPMAVFENLIDDFDIEKMRIFSKSGIIVYSTDIKEIGNRNDGDYFHLIVSKGFKHTKAIKKGDKTIDGVKVDFSLLETYVPIIRNNDFIGAFELYFDITDKKRSLDNSVLLSTFIPIFLIFAFFLFFIFLLKEDQISFEAKESLGTKFRSPFFFLAILAISIFIIETCVMLFLSSWKPSSILIEAVFDSTVLVLILAPVLYFSLVSPLMSHIGVRSKVERELRKTQEELEERVRERTREVDKRNKQLAIEVKERSVIAQELLKSNKVKTSLNFLLRYTLENPPLGKLLEYFIEQVTSIPEFGIQDRGAIFLVEEDTEFLLLKAHRNLAPQLIDICEKVPFGKCLCGRAATEKKPIFVNNVCGEHENTFEGIRPHGHYCIPITTSDKTLRGVFTVYVNPDVEHSDEIENFLVSMASVLGGIIQNRANEEKRLASDEKTQVIANTATDAIIMMNDQGEIEFWNPAATKIFGYSLEEAIGRDLHKLIAPIEIYPLYKNGLSNFLRTGTGRIISKTIEVTGRNKAGEHLPLELSVSSVIINNKYMAVGIVRDISERKTSEKEREGLQNKLRQAQKLEAIGTLASGIAHDFNNILTSIIGYSSLLEDSVKKDDQALGDLEQVLIAANRAKNLVKQILTFSRQTEQELIPVEFSIVIKEAIKLLRAIVPTTIDIKINIINEERVVLADPTQLHQIVINLCTNAFQACRDGDTIEVALDDKQPSPEFLATHPNMEGDSFVCLRVKDTGHGMDTETLGRIFEPYFSTKKKQDGTGLGLSVVHGIVIGIGGGIEVKSEVGKGTEFSVYLPRIKEIAAALEDEKTEPVPGGKEHILYVDDELPIIKLAERILGGLGYEVSTRTSSVEALEAFRDHPSRYDMIVTDQSMPNMSGQNLAEEIKKIRPDIPIVLCTGFDDGTNNREGRNKTIAEVLLKPVSKKQLGETIRRIFAATAGEN